MIPTTGIAAIDWFLALLDHWGYAIVFGFTVLENIVVAGSFTPGETVVIAASFVASNKGLALLGVWISSVVGTILGSNISYTVGRRAGMESVRAFVLRVAATRMGRLLKVSDEGLDDVQEHFDDHGVKTVFISRFAVGAKNLVPAVAGATKMPAFWFELYTVIGAVVYTSTMCAVGWLLGTNFDLAIKVATTIGWVGLGTLVIFVSAAWLTARSIRRRRAERKAHGHAPGHEHEGYTHAGIADIDGDEPAAEDPE